MGVRQLSRHTGMYSCLVALMTHVCRDAKQPSDSSQFASLRLWTSTCAEMMSTRGITPAEAVIPGQQPSKTENFNYRKILHEMAGLWTNCSSPHSNMLHILGCKWWKNSNRQVKHCHAFMQQNSQQGKSEDKSMSVHRKIIRTDMSALLITDQCNSYGDGRGRISWHCATSFYYCQFVHKFRPYIS